VKLRNPQFEGQTKTKLGNTEMRSMVEKVTNEKLADWLEENPTEANKITKKGIAASQARMAAKKARDVIRSKTLLDGAGMPDKLKDCTSKSREERELFIVEGDSAGGPAVMGRNPATQAILPIRGKILNVERARLDKMLKNLEIQALISAIGAGVGEEFDVEKRRYDKVIAMCDADVDGSHIRTLLLTFFYRNMKSLVDHGHIFIAQPPLYSMEVGKEKIYLKDDAAKAEFLAANPEHKKDFQRLKGLGEMDWEELQVTTMDPEQRTLLLTFFFRQMRHLVESGHVYIAQPPLYSTEVGREKIYLKDDAAKAQFLADNPNHKKDFQRLKGLGEMDWQELQETTMDPQKRSLLRVTVEQAALADEVMSILMGDDVESRKQFIITNASDVRFLDI
jgi:DNA gyrase/topoisomerase IV subunit B